MYALWFYFIKNAVTLLRTLAYVMQWSNQKGETSLKQLLSHSTTTTLLNYSSCLGRMTHILNNTVL